ncbi:MAG: cytidylate kinase-like family protein [Desulfobacterales bacterium]|nr:MAG: cytidylate kinase-like family protein [Desulfobacterales bacterium]
MAKEKTSIKQFVRDQVKKWERMYSQADRQAQPHLPSITLSMEPGSGGSILAQQIADRLDFDLFNREIVEEIAKSAEIRETVIETLEKDRLSGIEDFIASLVKDYYIHPDLYLEHLFKVISTIAEHGRALIVGRGANFILPASDIFAVRVIAPLEIRIRNVALGYNVSAEEAKRRVIQRESRRKAFVRHSFNAEISDPIHYNMVVNTGKMSMAAAVEAVIAAVMTHLASNP